MISSTVHTQGANLRLFRGAGGVPILRLGDVSKLGRG